MKTIGNILNGFIPGSKIITRTGLKNIEDIQIGDIVTSYNVKTKLFYDEECFDISRFRYNGELIKVILSDDKEIILTPESDILTSDLNYIKAYELNECVLKSYLTKDVKSINICNYNGYLYNLSVKNNSNYMVSGVVALNHKYKYLNYEND